MPLTDGELQALLADPESDRVERKSSASDLEKIRQAICAFANDLPGHGKPGVIFVGLDDGGSCSGLEITDELLVKLAGIRSEGLILPVPSLTVQRRTLAGCDVAVVEVMPADAPPVRLKGRVWVRVGPRRDLATPEEERRLAERRRARDLPFDLRPLPSVSRGELDLELFRRTYLPAAVAEEVRVENRRSIEDQLASLRFTTSAPEHTPTVLGVLTLGIDPRGAVPGAWIQLVRLDGDRTTDPIKESKEISGPLIDQLRRLDDVLEANVSAVVDFRSGRTEVRRPDYPLVALQQLTRNAVLHRNYEGTGAPVRITWYSDRIEILSPGGPYGQVTRANFGQPGVTDYRNPNLAAVMRDLGYVQRFGFGLAIAREELARNGNPPVELDVQDTMVLATVRRAP